MVLRTDLVSAYWRYHELRRGSRPERLASEELLWAWPDVERAVTEDPDVLDLFDALLAAPTADAITLGCGPLEDLLQAHGARWQRDIAARCRGSASWAEAVGCVWLDTEAEALVPLLAAYRPGRLTEAPAGKGRDKVAGRRSSKSREAGNTRRR